MSKTVTEFKAQVDTLLAESVGFTSDDFSDVDWYALNWDNPEQAALEILELEGYPVDLLDVDASGSFVLG